MLQSASGASAELATAKLGDERAGEPDEELEEERAKALDTELAGDSSREFALELKDRCAKSS